VLKRHGVGEREGELGADFGSLVLPSPALRNSRAELLTKALVVDWPTSISGVLLVVTRTLFTSASTTSGCS
jgi:hypothetical protein